MAGFMRRPLVPKCGRKEFFAALRQKMENVSIRQKGVLVAPSFRSVTYTMETSPSMLVAILAARKRTRKSQGRSKFAGRGNLKK
eukprot:scaffold3608_cov183-Amphora_coffeaeformis.AAC.28